ncbi:MAG: hypothetical protein IIB09_05150 [Bacteroidetes bacterium]|nr:hypothetical protein [Bacteroidota bacterium]
MGSYRSERLGLLPPYLFVEIDRKKSEAIEAGRDIIDLGVGDPDQPTPAFIIEKMAEATETRYFFYVTLFPPTDETTVGYSFLSGGVRADQRLGVSTFGQVWDAEGDVAWEGMGSSEMKSGYMLSISAEGRDFSVHSNNAARALFRAMLGLEPEED